MTPELTLFFRKKIGIQKAKVFQKYIVKGLMQKAMRYYVIQILLIFAYLVLG